MNRTVLIAASLLLLSAIGCGAELNDTSTQDGSLADTSDAQELVPGGELAPAPAVRCRQAVPPAVCDAAPNLSVVHAVLVNAGNIEVVAQGDTCAETVTGFGFRVFNAEGQDITGRSWPELESIEVQGESFILRGDAAGCANYSGATHLEVVAMGEDQVVSNTIRVEIDRSQFTE